MTQLNGANCGNCRFSVVVQDKDGKIDFKRRMCKKNPPTHCVFITPRGLESNCFWPVLDSSAHCFSHEPLPGEAGKMPPPEGSA